MKKEKFIPTNYGWISPKTPPVNHHNIVLLLWETKDEMYLEIIGYYQDGWQYEDSETESFIVKGWSPYPYSPHNV